MAALACGALLGGCSSVPEGAPSGPGGSLESVPAGPLRARATLPVRACLLAYMMDVPRAKLFAELEGSGLFAALVEHSTTKCPADVELTVKYEGVKTELMGSGLTMSYTLYCYQSNGRLIATYSAAREMEASTSVAENQRRMDAVAFEAGRIVLAQLIADERAHEKIRAAAAAAAPATAAVAPVAPVPVPAPAPAAPAAALPPGSTYVLIVGIDAYADPAIPALRFAEADAREVYTFFATERRSPTEADRVRLLAGKDATRRSVLEAIREHLVAKAIRPEDTVVLYFAGHGFADAQESYLACHDTELAGLPETGISVGALNDYWAKVAARRKVLLVDACHSGNLGNVRGIGGVAMAPPAPEAPASPAGGGAASSLTVASAGANELSVEDPSLGHGVFTVALLKGLRGEADRDRDGRVTGDELGDFLVTEVRSLAALARGKQTPVVGRTAGGPAIYLTR